MSEVIRFLESMGRNPAMSPAQFAASVSMLQADDALKQALLKGNAASLNDLLGGRAAPMMMSQYAPLEEPQRRDDDQEGEEPSQDPTPDSEQAN